MAYILLHSFDHQTQIIEVIKESKWRRGGCYKEEQTHQLSYHI